MTALRASKLPLLLKCPGSATMLVDDTPTKNAEDGAAWGTMVHRWKETGEIEAPSKRLGTALRKALELSGLGDRRLEYWPEGGRHEVSMAIRVDGVREVRDNADRKLDGVDGWVTGTADYTWWLLDGKLYIDDLKTSKFYPNPPPGDERHDPGAAEGGNRFPPNPTSEQVRTYALGLAELLGHAGDVVTSITHWPRLPLAHRHSLPEQLWGELTRDDLMDHWTAMELLYQQVLIAAATGEAFLNPGDHCRFCPSRTFCARYEESKEQA